MGTISKKVITSVLAVLLTVSLIPTLAACEFGSEKTTPSSENSEATVSDATAASSDTTDTSGKETFLLEKTYGTLLAERLNKSYMIGDKTISAGEYNYYYVVKYMEITYNFYGSYPELDDGKLDLSADCLLMENPVGTWADYLDAEVFQEIQQRYIAIDLAEKSGIELSDAQLEEIAGYLVSYSERAASEGYTENEFYDKNFGDDMTRERFEGIMTRYYLSELYNADFAENYTLTDEDMEVPIARHILYMALTNSPYGDDATEEELEEARLLAEGALNEIHSYEDMVLVGDREFTAKVASESAEYTVSRGLMVEGFEDWCYDPSREIGDKEVIQTSYGFHVVYFVGTTQASETEMSAIIITKRIEMYEEKALLPEYEMVLQ